MFPLIPKFRLLSIKNAIATAILCSPVLIASGAQAAPLPKDWCGRIWGVVSTGSIIWDNPNTAGASNTLPPTNVAAIPAMPAITGTAGYATLGIHARTGTFYSLDRGSGKISQYSMSTGGAWTQSAAVVPVIINGNASTNYNKMTVTGDNLIIANSASTTVYTFPITPATGALGVGNAVTYGFNNDTILPNGTTGNPPGTTNIDGGDIAQDEYGNTYMMTYDNAGAGVTTQYAYFYKRSGTTWIYKGRAIKATNTDQFAGLAVYNDDLYLKGTAGQLFKLDFAGVGTGTGTSHEYPWSTVNNSTLTTFATGTGVSDLATCGVPAINVTKTQSIYSDPAATTLTTDQTRIGAGQYIKYTIVNTNSGDAWARGVYMNDLLPPGVTYVPNTATENGINLNAATYPFDTQVVTSPGSTTGEVRLPYGNNSGTSTYSFIAQVTGTPATVANQAKVAWLNPYPSDPSDCATGLNCGTSPTATYYPSIFGKIWNDTNGSANNSFLNIPSTGETGTNTGATLYALLIDSTNKVLQSQLVAADGTYSFPTLNNSQNNLTVRLSTTAGTIGSAPPTGSIPAGWKNTSPTTYTAFNLGTLDVKNVDFGISQPANTILVKRITAINGQTTNPNDGTVLNSVLNNAATTNDDPSRKWPASYLKGAFNAGIIRPRDTIEYTVYYLNDSGADTKTLKICDPIRGLQKYVPGSMKLQSGGAAVAVSLTDAIDITVDRANPYGAAVPAALPAVAPPTDCNISSNTVTGRDNGGIAIQITGTGASTQPDLSALLGATAAGSPTTSYGLIKFITKVDP